MTNRMVSCNYCKATGRVDSGYGGFAKTMCPVCFGRKQISIDLNAKKCRDCNGTGSQKTGYHTLGLVKHNSCRGTGWIAPVKTQAANLVAPHNNIR
jgi:DnaJ-class molecular chaperone